MLKKKKIKKQIIQIYHSGEGVIGYRQVKIYLERKGVYKSFPTIHKYMNKELELYSITRRKKPGHVKTRTHKDEKTLYSAIEEFAYVTYNHKRPHSYNNYNTPFETRYIA